jgi:predicted HAD superfamily Cof-like phosphohydrolase
MNKWQKDVLDFQVKYKNYHQSSVSMPSDEIIEFRKDLIIEEVVEELLYALDTKDMVKVADGIADSIYVLLGTAIAFGIDLEPIWEAVHDSNMKKVRHDMSDEANNTIHKVVKPEGWQPPDIEGLLKAQGWKK